MNINSLFDNPYDINIHNYLQKCGIDDVKGYLKGNSIEPTTNYDNIDEWCIELNYYCDNNKTIYILVDCDMDGYLSSKMAGLSVFAPHARVSISRS